MSKLYTRRKASTPIGWANPVEGLRQPGGGVWALWVLGYAVGGTAGSLISSIVTALFSPQSTTISRTSPLPQVIVALVGSFIFGAILGTANWLVLFRYMKRSALWPVLTGAGLALGTAIVTLLFPFFFPLAASANSGDPGALFKDAANGAVIGLLIGAAQATLLVRRVTDTWGVVTYVLTSGLGWVGLVLLDSLLLSFSSATSTGGPFIQITILLLGFTLAGLLSGFEIPSLLKKHQQQLREENPLDARSTTVARTD